MKRRDGTYEEDIQCIVTPQNSKGGIFISNIEAAKNHKTLAKFGIGCVITLVRGQNMADTMPKHIEYLYVPAIDHESFDLSPFFSVTHQLLCSETRRTNVLVHCMAGVSRSATIVIAHLMQAKNLSLKEAFDFVKSKRNIIHPNQSFIRQLKQLEQSLRPSKVQMMEADTASSWHSTAHSRAKQQKSSLKDRQPKSNQSYDEQLRQKIGQLFSSRQRA